MNTIHRGPQYTCYTLAIKLVLQETSLQTVHYRQGTIERTVYADSGQIRFNFPKIALNLGVPYVQMAMLANLCSRYTIYANATACGYHKRTCMSFFEHASM